ncbi:MAG: adventurous gliding motility protein CglE [Bdellovibrionota bacterium]
MKKCVLAALFVSLFSYSSQADQLFGDFKRLPDEIERGFSIGADFGFHNILGDNLGRRSAANPGFSLTFVTGYDIFDYLSIEGLYTIALNEASPNDVVLEGGVNTFLFDLAAKIQYPMGRFYPFAQIGAGIFYSHPSFTFNNDNYKLDILGGLGIEYYTFLRHYSLYVKTTFHYIDLPINSIGFSGGLRYTF